MGVVDRPVQVTGTRNTKTTPPTGNIQGCVYVYVCELIKTMAVCLARIGSGGWGAHLNRYKEEGMFPREFEKAA